MFQQENGILKELWLRKKLKKRRMVHTLMNFNRECNIYCTYHNTCILENIQKILKTENLKQRTQLWKYKTKLYMSKRRNKIKLLDGTMKIDKTNLHYTNICIIVFLVFINWVACCYDNDRLYREFIFNRWCINVVLKTFFICKKPPKS